jgi:alpha-tubulin suppressor-like RCC1 family protein
MALSKSGKVFVWGNNTYGQLGIGSLKNVQKPEILEALVK